MNDLTIQELAEQLQPVVGLDLISLDQTLGYVNSTTRTCVRCAEAWMTSAKGWDAITPLYAVRGAVKPKDEYTTTFYPWGIECSYCCRAILPIRHDAFGQLLFGHTSFETAHVTDDYPYGRQLRCTRREWVEYNGGKGYRFVTRTTNPKANDVWNKPHAATYDDFLQLYINDIGHVSQIGLQRGWGSPWVLAKLAHDARPFMTGVDQRNLDALAKYDRIVGKQKYWAYDVDTGALSELTTMPDDRMRAHYGQTAV